jgi:hypothetical protein
MLGVLEMLFRARIPGVDRALIAVNEQPVVDDLELLGLAPEHHRIRDALGTKSAVLRNIPLRVGKEHFPVLFADEAIVEAIVLDRDLDLAGNRLAVGEIGDLGRNP